MKLIKDNFSETEYWMGFSMKRQCKLELKKEEILSCVKKKKKKVTGKGIRKPTTDADMGIVVSLP